MINITEADHDAVDWLYEMGVIAPHHLRLANEAFACHREQAERQAADRIEALEAALSWALIQLGSETGYNMESPIWHAYDRARDVLNGVRK